MPSTTSQSDADSTNTAPDLRHIHVRISHPSGELSVPLAEWMRRGPGPRRLLRPHSVVDARTGHPLPLSVIPLRYRNTPWSRLLCKLGVLPHPWREPRYLA